MIFKSLVFISVLLFSSFGFSQEEKDQEQENQGRSKEKKIHVTASVTGLFPFFQAGTSAGYSVLPDLIVEAQYYYTDFVFGNTKHQSTLMGVKKFWFNSSFHTGFLAGLLRYQSSVGVNKTDESTHALYADRKIYTDVTAESWVAGFMIGNRWVLNNGFIVGCDWLTVLLPFAVEEKKSLHAADPEADQEDYEKVRKEQEEESTVGSIRIVSPYIGWAF